MNYAYGWLALIMVLTRAKKGAETKVSGRYCARTVATMRDYGIGCLPYGSRIYYAT